MSVPCENCGLSLVIPARLLRVAERLGRPYVQFCSAKCNKTYVAREGVKSQEEIFRAGHSDAHSSP